MELRVLGPLEVTAGHEIVLISGGRQRTALLTALALHPGDVVSTATLVDLLWGESPPHNAANALQGLVSKLRAVLGNDLIARQGSGYTLKVRPEQVDAVQFERLAAAGREALKSGDFARADERLTAALALWRGEVFSEFTGGIPAELTRLAEERLAVLEDRIDADLACGRDGALIAELESLVARHPLRERLWGQLIVALYRGGRQADALRAYQRARQVLAEDLGIEPSAELHRLEAAVLAHDSSLDRPAAPRPRAGAEPSPTNLQTELTSFIGRIDALDSVCALLDAHRLVTLTGPGGAGKTRLAMEAARRRLAQHPDGVWVVELAPLTDPHSVASIITTTIGLREGAEVGGGNDSRPVTARLVEFLRERQVLLLLDNCEHLVAEAAALAEQLLVSSPGLHVLATSREGLAVPGERLWPVPPLPLEDAVALFVDRARGVLPAFTPTTHEASVIADICRRLDGLPLAVELAAARVSAFSLTEIAYRLHDRFRLLIGGSRTALPRQQTLRAVVDWSYELLDEEERLVVERLSVFAGGCSLAAAEAVCSGDGVDRGDVATIIARLVAKSLVVAHPRADQARYWQLQTIVDYGRERLAARGDAASVRARHIRWFEDFAGQVDRGLQGANQQRWLDAADTELDNLRAAMDWCIVDGQADAALSIAGALGWYWWYSGQASDGWRWLAAALGSPAESSAVLRARALAFHGWLGLYTATAAQAVSETEQAVALLRGAGDPEALALAAVLHAGATWSRGDSDSALASVHEAQAVLHGAEDAWILTVARLIEGMAHLAACRLDEAEEALKEAVDRFRVAGDQWGVSYVYAQLGDLYAVRGDYQKAADLLDEAIALAARSHLRAYDALVSAHRGMIAVQLGDADAADQYLSSALAKGRELAIAPVAGLALTGKGLLARRFGRLDDAERSLQEALAIFQASSLPSERALVLASLGYVAELRGDAVEAQQRHADALDAARQIRNARGMALAIEGLAGAAALRGDGEQAARLLGSAAGLRDQFGGQLPSPERMDVDRAIERALGLVRPEVYAAAFDQGRQASLDDILAEQLITR